MAARSDLVGTRRGRIGGLGAVMCDVWYVLSMTTPAAPTAIRFSDEDRQNLDALCVFWGTENMAAVVRLAIAHERRFIEAMKTDSFDVETTAFLEVLREQYQKRLAELRAQHAALMAEGSPLVAAAR